MVYQKALYYSGVIMAGLIAIGVFSDSPQDLQTQQGQVIEIKNLPTSRDSVIDSTVPEPDLEVEEKENLPSTATPTIISTPIVQSTPKPSATPKPIATQQPKATSSCDPNYSGCVPIASDVDCAGGSGNGPAYVRGPVYVIGNDIYDLDRDGDGVACDK